MDHVSIGLFVIAAGIAMLIFTESADSPDSPSGDPNMDAINNYIVAPLGLPIEAAKILYIHASKETGGFSSHVFSVTNSLFNRHKGNGIAGQPDSDGYWTGNVYYASSNDPDLRVYSSVDQSARDMGQLLSDGLYAQALSALRNNDAAKYYLTLQSAGFNPSNSYAQELIDQYNQAYA